ncbi:NAD(P)H dehydrogenase B2, mitochondrial [Apostasia shenzhenica]|uniref:NADH:ubiquinone reductase (non-electrogenic) n=1 Tax=Apostasia shenzhenica TaxID=1088818 RepID=A0A2I0BFJ5_9ASPA|nr:NAD(P)H dehydrogenase B2, mitochondrial [Apostasia shenzhenica]
MEDLRGIRVGSHTPTAISDGSGESFHLLCTVRQGGPSGGLIAYADAKPEQDVEPLQEPRKKVLVLGTGWAGTTFLRNLDSSLYDVQVISPRNYFAFTPLLPSVTCGTVEARSIVEPIRRIIRKKKGETKFLEAECFKIDPANKKVHCRYAGVTTGVNEEFLVDYDYLVIAIGARANTFNIPGVEQNCHFLKEIEDAQKIRRNVMGCFERACLPDLNEEERKKNLHFVIVGGGPTGVEFAAELHDFVSEDLSKLYPSVCDLVKISVIEAGACKNHKGRVSTGDSSPKTNIGEGLAGGCKRIVCFTFLNVNLIQRKFDKRITKFAEEKFQRDGIDVKTGFKVVKVSDKDITVTTKSTGEISLPYGMAVWSTGIGTRPVILDFMKQVGQGNRRVLATDEWLRVHGADSVYALGDCATISQRKVVEDISQIFKVTDKDNSGTLTVKEIQDVLDDICIRYPQVELYLKSKQMSSIVDLLKDSKGDVEKEAIELNIEEFKQALADVDSQVKNLPATAQGILLEGFNFSMGQVGDYKHLGQFAPLGGEQTAAQLPGDWISIGHSSQWLWYSVYARYEFHFSVWHLSMYHN